MGYEGFNGTLTYSESVSGWPSFYSFDPDFMIGMNNYFYSFKGGNLYRHNSESIGRNTFYYDYWYRLGIPDNAFTASYMKGVFNESVLENKLFKTIVIEGTDAWEVDRVKTDGYQEGYIDYNWFEKKENDYFAFIRNYYGESTDSISGFSAFRDISGIGNSLTVDSTNPLDIKINFSIRPLITFSNLSVGDYLFFDQTELKLAGIVTGININYPLGVNQIIVSSVLPPNSPPYGPLTPITSNVNYFLYAKNMVAESQGVLGHYCVFELTNPSSNPVQLFSIGTEVMKSFP